MHESCFLYDLLQLLECTSTLRRSVPRSVLAAQHVYYSAVKSDARQPSFEHTLKATLGWSSHVTYTIIAPAVPNIDPSADDTLMRKRRVILIT